jgi:hypothetical protein
MNSENRVFISYAKEDIGEAKRIYNDLKSNGIELWMDSEDLLPGQKWRDEIKKAIKKSAYFLILISNKSLTKKGFIQNELKIALDILNELPESTIFIIPVRIEDCEPDDELIRERQWVDLFESYENGLDKILKVVKSESTEDHDELELYISKLLDLSKLDLSKFEKRKEWVHYRLLWTGFDGDEYVYIFWDEKRRKLTKSFRSWSGTTWYKGNELNEEDKKNVREVLKI